MLRASYTQPGFSVSVQLGGLIKKIAMYLLAVAIPLGLILVYEGFISSKNREFFQEQERKSNQQQALEQPWLGFGPGQSAVSSFFNLEMHNVFLEVFFEGGVIGLVALLVTLAGLFRIHHHLPIASPADRKARIIANGFGLSLLFAVTFSTSFVDQLMSFLLYQILLAYAGVTVNPHPNAGFAR